MLRLLSVAACAAMLPAITAFSTADLISVFGATATDLTGSVTELPMYTLSIVTNSTHALFGLNSTTPTAQVGWWGIAGGTSMFNGDFLLAWPNPDLATGPASQPWTISHRVATSENQPLVASTVSTTSTANFYTLLSQFTTNPSQVTPFTSVAWIRPLNPGMTYPVQSEYSVLSKAPEQNFIFASSDASPENSAEDAVLTQHDQAHAAVKIDLSQPISLTGTPTSSSNSTGTGMGSGTNTGSGNGTASSSSGTEGSSGSSTTYSTPPLSKRDMYIIAHAALGSIALLVISPLAILVGRFFSKTGATWWFPTHASLNLVSAAMVVATFGLGLYVTSGTYFDDTHEKVGLAIFILVMIQVFIGWFAHKTGHQTGKASGMGGSSAAGAAAPPRRSAIRWFHILTGIATIILSFYQVYALGFPEWTQDSDRQNPVPMAVKTVFWILLGIVALLWVVGVVKEIFMRRRVGRISSRGGSIDSEKDSRERLR